ncbi:MAG: 3-hydroxyacyl-CoA dehydrogenase, partial [Rhodospirillaceae bacterium]|nr:3-hydroxyacyl-CoA dehydrogenase [Rhodospirillaceae bacterium]
GTDFVQESAPEQLKLKQSLFKQIDEYTSKNIIVSSSTSGLIMSDMQDRLENANRFVVGHPFNPPHLIPLVEVLGGKNTDVLAVDWAINFYNKIGKHAIKLKKEVPGHLANRLQAALWREAVLAVQNDLASVEDINAAVAMGPGLRWALMGPHMIMNLTGGAGGYRKMLDHFGPGISGWWETMNENPQLSTVLKKELINGIEEEAKGRSIAQLEEERDEQLVELLIMLKRLKKTGH